MSPRLAFIALASGIIGACNAILDNEEPIRGYPHGDSGDVSSDSGESGSRDGESDALDSAVRDMLSEQAANDSGTSIVDGVSRPDGMDAGVEDVAMGDAFVGSDSARDVGPSDSGAVTDAFVDVGAPKDVAVVDSNTNDHKADTPDDRGGTTDGGDGANHPDSGQDSGTVGCPTFTRFTLGVHIILDVTWKGSTATNDGSGVVHLWNKAVLNANGTALSGEAMSCGTTLPDIDLNGAGTVVTGKSKVSVQIPFAAWDAPSVPKFGQSGMLAGWAVGSDIKMDPTVALVGLAMPDPMAAWPASFVDIMGADAEGDGALGITGVGKNDTTYTYPPTGLGVFGSAPLADKVYVASRTAVQLTGKTTSCEEQAGTATAQFFDNHIIGCHIFNGGDCTATGAGSQTDFLDASRAVYVPGAGTFASKKLADNATCADVRAALP